MTEEEVLYTELRVDEVTKKTTKRAVVPLQKVTKRALE